MTRLCKQRCKQRKILFTFKCKQCKQNRLCLFTL
nr:MAG TPA: hypothetical protein [Caudoviricetes sp.]